MKIQTIAALSIAALSLAPFAHAKPTTTKRPTLASQLKKPLPFDTIPARGGVIKITPILHASIQIEYRGKVILVDPISAGSYRKKADYVLITHPHGDHLDKNAIAKVIRRGGAIVLPYVLDPNATSRLPAVDEFRSFKKFHEELQALSPNPIGDYGLVGPGGKERDKFLLVEAVAAYNILRGQKPGAKYHPKEANWNGYILTLGGKRIYIAGDTEATPEMKALKNIDAAFLPINLPYTMTPLEAANAVRAFKPKVVYPYHFRFPFDKPNTNVQQFATALRGSKSEVRILDWYNAGRSRAL